jgi:carbon storage regulator
MLILSRKVNEQIMIGDDIVLTITEIRHGSVRIGVTAPVEMPIIRDELIDRRSGRPLVCPVQRPDGKK